jgi:hypothetical protein
LAKEESVKGLRVIALESRKAHLILGTKGYDPLTEVKAAAERWVAAVNADGSYGKWYYRIARKPEEVRKMISDVCGVLVAV